MLYTDNKLRLTLRIRREGMRKIITIFMMTIAIFLLSACSKHYEYIQGKINILTTTTMLGDLAEQIGQDRVSVTVLMKPGADPHSYKPKPSDRYAAKTADLIIYNGLHLEAKMSKLFTNINPTKTFIAGELISQKHLIKDFDNQIDPHIWFNIEIWKELSLILKERLQKEDPLHKDKYDANYQKYLEALNQTELEIRAEIETLRSDQRILITAHDAFSYFGKAYGFEVHAIQGISTETEASTKDIQTLAKLIKELKVKAIFIENSIPEATIKGVIDAAKALGQDIIIGGELYSDSLGDQKSEANTYIKMIKHNVTTIVKALR